MTARQRRIYWNRERNKAVKYINKYRGKFYRALQADMQGFKDALQNSEQAARRYINTLLFSDGISNTLNILIKEVGVKYARDNYNTLRKEKQFFPSEEWVQMIMDYLGTNFYNQGVLQIVQTSRAMMLDILDRGNREGWGYYDYARYISETVPGLNQNRADMIARTEVGRAIHAGTFVGADKSPFQKQKMWVAAKDNRTRGNPANGQKDKADHWHLDGQTVDFNAKFVDSRSGSELDHPHDPQAKAVDVIRCRCTFVVINKRDKNGNLIRKNTGMVLPISRPLNVPPPPPPQEIRPTFVPARNIKEAEQYALQNLGIKYANYKGVNIDIANDMNKAIFNIKQVMPTIRTLGIGSAQEANKAIKADIKEWYYQTQHYKDLVNKFGEKYAGYALEALIKQRVENVGSGTLAWSAGAKSIGIKTTGESLDLSKYAGVYVNNKFSKSKEAIDEIVTKNGNSGWFTKDAKDFGYIMTHEIGHEIDKSINFKADPRFLQIFDREHNLGVNQLIQKLSKYGATAGGNKLHLKDEMIAESWAEFMTSPTPRPLSREIGELMLKRYYEVNQSDIKLEYNSWVSEIRKIIK